MLSLGPFDEALRERARAHLDRFERRVVALAGLRAAAVALAMLADAHGRPCFLITRRTPTLRAHAGQWALPGGRIEPGESPESAVVREVEEEVGLRLPEDSILGVLDDYPTNKTSAKRRELTDGNARRKDGAGDGGGSRHRARHRARARAGGREGRRE